mgnify:CR=1 FL=1
MTFNDCLDIEIHEMNSQTIELRIPFKEEFKNELGACHGAIIMAIADIATGLLANELKHSAPTQSSYTNFLNPILKTKYIYAKSQIIKRGSRTVTVDCKIWSDDSNLAAVNRSEFTIIQGDFKKNPSKFSESLKSGNYKKY